MAKTRNELKTDVFYVLPSGEVFTTPNGVGGFWYENLRQALYAHGQLVISYIESIPEN